MRFKLTLFLLLANVIAFTLIVYQSTKSAAHPDYEQSIFSSGISKISISTPKTGETFTLETRGKDWFITSPFEWQANSFAVRQMISELRFLDAEGGFSLAEAKAGGSTPADYGLETPSIIATIRDDGGMHELRFGKETPDKRSVYAFYPASGRIIPVARELFLNFSKKPDDFRIPEIFSCRPYEVESIVVRAMFKSGSEQRIGLVRAWNDREFAGEKATRIWRFETPISANADTRLVEAKLGELISMRCKNFSKGDFALLERTGLKSPQMRFTLEGSKNTETLLIGNEYPEDASQLFAKLENNDAIFTVPADKVNSWRTAPTDLRDARFLDFDPTFLRSITIHGEKSSLSLLRTDATEPAVKDADAGQVALAGEGEQEANASTLGVISSPSTISSASDPLYASWQMPVSPGSLVTRSMDVDPEAIRRLVERLRDLRATKYPESDDEKKQSLEQRVLRSAFVSDFVSDETAAAMNFNVPVRVVELVFQAPQTAQAGDTTAAPLQRVVTLTIAPPVDPDSPYHAKVGSSVYSIESGILDELSVEPSFYRERTVYKLPEGASITSISLSYVSGESIFSASRSAVSSEWEIIGDIVRPTGAKLSKDTRDIGMAPDEAEIEALEKVCENIRADAFLSKPFSRDFTYDYMDTGAPEGWRYVLEFSVKVPSSATAEAHTLYLTKRLGGTFQLAGSASQNCVFKISQKFIDAIHAVTFAKDPSKDVPFIADPPKQQQENK